MNADAIRLFFSFAFLPTAAVAAAVAGIELPPLPTQQPVVYTHWGVQVEDPYRFLENTSDPEIQKYMRAQADAAHAILQKIPGRERLLARIKEIEADSPAQVTNVQRDRAGNLFFLKREASDNQFKLYRREGGAAGRDTLLVDPDIDTRAKGAPHAIGAYTPSHDGKLLAYQVYAGGSEIGDLRVIDVATRKEVTPAIDRVRFGQAGWLEDGSGFFYARLAEGYETRPRAERFMDMRTHLRRLAAPDLDVAVFGAGMYGEVAMSRSDSGFTYEIPGQPLVAAVIFHGVSPNRSMYLADRDAFFAGRPKWRKVLDPADQVNEVETGGGFLYVRTSKDAPRFKVMRMTLPDADLSRATTLVAHGDNVVTAMKSALDGLYVTRREGAAKRLMRVKHEEAAAPVEVAMPFDGNIALHDVKPRLEGALLSLASWTRTASHYFVGPRDARPAPLNLVPRGKFDAPSGLTAREVKVKSHDGVEVPVSIISRTDIKLDGRNATMLYGYGAYGIVEDPSWTPRTLAFLEQGGVIAMAHVRGGGIYGDGWRRAGWKATKPNTWKDGIASAQWLIDNGYTSASRLSIYGGSAGGIFVGRAITERPDLFSAAIIGVGNTDSIRSETRANGVGNIPEYGTVKIEEEFRALKVMSPYANVAPKTRYPALLLEHGVNDSRVDVWMTLKFGTHVAASSVSGKPVLMRLEYDAGHGAGATREQAQLRLADRWAFMLWQAGLPDFQPR